VDKWSLIAASDVYNLSGTRACNKESAPPLPSPQTPPDKHNTCFKIAFIPSLSKHHITPLFS